MYNGIGLTTTRGSGTSGHVQANRFKQRRPRQGGSRRGDGRDAREREHAKGFNNRKPNEEILEHERKRKIELEVFKLRDELEERGVDEAEIEERVKALRARLERDAQQQQQQQSSAAAASKGGGGRGETHAVAERKRKQMDTLARALNVRPDLREGEAFDRELQEQRKRERIAEREQRRKEAEERREAEAAERARRARDAGPPEDGEVVVIEDGRSVPEPAAPAQPPVKSEPPIDIPPEVKREDEGPPPIRVEEEVGHPLTAGQEHPPPPIKTEVKREETAPREPREPREGKGGRGGRGRSREPDASRQRRGRRSRSRSRSRPGRGAERPPSRRGGRGRARSPSVSYSYSSYSYSYDSYSYYSSYSYSDSGDSKEKGGRDRKGKKVMRGV